VRPSALPRSIERGPVEAAGLPAVRNSLEGLPRSIERGPVEARARVRRDVGVNPFRAQLSAAPLKRGVSSRIFFPSSPSALN